MKKILVIRLSALGDVVRTLPAVVSIHDAFPDSEITWATETLGASFVKGHPCVANVLVFPTRVWRKKFFSPTGFAKTASQFLACLKKLRSVEYDMVVDFHGVLKSGIICRLARSPRKVGYDKTGARELSYLSYTEKVSLPEGKLSRYTRNMKLAEHLGGPPPDPASLIHVPSRISTELAGFFESIAGAGPLFTVHPGTSARAPYKRWLPERYAQLCSRIIDQMGARVVLTWAPDELDFVKQIVNMTGGKARTAPKTETPVHLAQILRQSDLYIGSDTGAMHIATLCGTPVVALWGPTNPVENEPGPYSPYEIANGGADCSPCRHMGCIKGHCMESITVDDVISSIEGLLERTR